MAQRRLQEAREALTRARASHVLRDVIEAETQVLRAVEAARDEIRVLEDGCLQAMRDACRPLPAMDLPPLSDPSTSDPCTSDDGDWGRLGRR